LSVGPAVGSDVALLRGAGTEPLPVLTAQGVKLVAVVEFRAGRVRQGARRRVDRRAGVDRRAAVLRIAVDVGGRAGPAMVVADGPALVAVELRTGGGGAFAVGFGRLGGGLVDGAGALPLAPRARGTRRRAGVVRARGRRIRACPVARQDGGRVLTLSGRGVGRRRRGRPAASGGESQ